MWLLLAIQSLGWGATFRGSGAIESASNSLSAHAPFSPQLPKAKKLLTSKLFRYITIDYVYFPYIWLVVMRAFPVVRKH